MFHRAAPARYFEADSHLDSSEPYTELDEDEMEDANDPDGMPYAPQPVLLLHRRGTASWWVKEPTSQMWI